MRIYWFGINLIFTSVIIFAGMVFLSTSIKNGIRRLLHPVHMVAAVWPLVELSELMKWAASLNRATCWSGFLTKLLRSDILARFFNLLLSDRLQLIAICCNRRGVWTAHLTRHSAELRLTVCCVLDPAPPLVLLQVDGWLAQSLSVYTFTNFGCLTISIKHFALRNLRTRFTFISSLSVGELIFRAVSFTLYMMCAKHFPRLFCALLVSRLRVQQAILSSVFSWHSESPLVLRLPGQEQVMSYRMYFGVASTEYPRTVRMITLPREETWSFCCTVVPRCASWRGLTSARSIVEVHCSGQTAVPHQHPYLSPNFVFGQLWLLWWLSIPFSRKWLQIFSVAKEMFFEFF